MKEFLGNPWFWVSVVLVTFVAHWVMTKFMAGGATS
jgi:hypothetical protein